MLWIRPSGYGKKDGLTPSSTEPVQAGVDIDNAAAGLPDAPGDGSQAKGPWLSRYRPMSAFQFFYIYVLHGVGAAIISGAINFGIAYAMYGNESRPIRLWRFPVTLAGDAAVTIILQCLITWFVEMLIVGQDLRTGFVRPLGCGLKPGQDSLPSPFVSWLLMLDDKSAAARVLGRSLNGETGIARRSALERFKDAVVFVGTQVTRAFMLVLPAFALLWAPSLAVLRCVAGRPDGADHVFESKWEPIVYKAVLGGGQALWITPLIAAFWMIRAGGWPEAVEESLEDNPSGTIGQ